MTSHWAEGSRQVEVMLPRLLRHFEKDRVLSSALMFLIDCVCDCGNGKEIKFGQIKEKVMKFRNMVCVLVLAIAGVTCADIASFDDNYLAPESHWGGAGSGETGFTSGDTYFPHNSDEWSWDGFVYSNETDTTTAGYTNQFSAITGGGVNDSSNFCVSYCAPDWMSGTYDVIPNTASFGAVTGNDYDSTISGAFFTNTTYAYLAMRDGEGPAKKFGGENGEDQDWFKLIVKGVDVGGEYTGTVEFYLADFRFEDNNQDYIIDDWTWVDLTGLGDVIGLEFAIDSSDVGDYGINTPTCFAMDDLNGVPEPATTVLLGLGAVLFARRKRA